MDKVLKYMDGDQVVLLDASSYLYRGYHAAEAKLNSKGQNIAAIQAFVKMFRRLVRVAKTNRIIVVFDADGKCFRHSICENYKATRPPMPSDLATQIPLVVLVMEAMGYPILRVTGVEADDVIATIATQIELAGEKVVIASPDKDLCQLITETTVTYDASKDVVYDVAGATDRIGVPPSLVLDYLAIVGDKADNIPGVKGVGDVTACKILNAIGPLSAVYENLDAVLNLDIRGAKGVTNKLREQKDNARLSHRLATLRKNVAVPCNISTQVKQDSNTEALEWLRRSLEINI